MPARIATRRERGQAGSMLSGIQSDADHDMPCVGRLWIVPTPIGHPDDITVRALQALRQCDLIAAEDPRITRRLMDRHGIATPIARCASAREEIDAVLARLRCGAAVALVCDVGTPTIADPGAALVLAAIRAKIEVIGLPGLSAVTAALAASGVASHRFAFDGFPPRGRADRHAFFAFLATEQRTIVLFESAAHVRSTIAALRDRLGAERGVAIARELTGPHERIWRGTLGAAAALARSDLPRGCYTIVVAAQRPNSAV